MPTDSVIVKLDFANAFNSLHRDQMLTAVNNILPELAPFCHLAYAKASTLQFGDYFVVSEVGAQQGDPLGPLLFCLPLQPVLTNLSSELTIGYLDDLTLGGKINTVVSDVETIEHACLDMGLHLNYTKCEVISSVSNCVYPAPLDSFTKIERKDAMLLGAPLSNTDALTTALEARCAELSIALDRLTRISRHDALILLRSSLSFPKLVYLLRCTACAGHPLLDRYDQLLRQGLDKIFNLSLTTEQWLQASLPIRAGGLGIRRASSLAIPAFLASAAGTRPLQSSLLSQCQIPEDELVETYLIRWRAESLIPEPGVMACHKQAAWDAPLVQRVVDELHAGQQNELCQARLKAVEAAHAGDWLQSLPVTSCGLRLDDEAIRISIGLRLGTNICQPHECPCGAQVTAQGLHGLSCPLGPGRTARHAALNDIVYRSLIRAGYPSIKEPAGLGRSDGKKPDGLTLIPWKGGRSLIWDATVTDTMAASYVPVTSRSAGAAAEQAAARKLTKYQAFTNQYCFIPLAFETLGPIGVDCDAFISDLGKRLTQISGEIRETQYLFQRLAVTVQRFNAVAFRGTFTVLNPPTSDEM